MVERVQITGQAGDGQYYDNKGRLLYAMGDINIVPGMWVWTNGKTIYGHQTAGEQSIINMTDGVMPFICSPNDDYGGISEVDAGKLSMKKLAKNGYNVLSYVGNAKHAYIQTYGREWFNVLTGEYLGTFEVDDACVGNDGSLLTIKGYSGFHFANANADLKEIKLYHRAYKTDGAHAEIYGDTVEINGRMISIGNVISWPDGGGWGIDSSRILPYGGDISATTPQISYKTIHNDIHENNQNGKIEIRKNGIVIKSIPILDYASSIQAEGISSLNEIHNSGSGTESESAVGYVKGGKIYGSGDTYPSRYLEKVDVGPRIRPKPDYSVYVEIRSLRIYEDASFDGFLSVAFRGSAYPFFDHEEFAPSISKTDLKIESTFFRSSIWDFTVLHPGGASYRNYESLPPQYDKLGEFLIVAPTVRRKSIWIEINESIDGIIKIADKAIIQKTNTIWPTPCIVPGPPSLERGGKPLLLKILQKYNLECCLLRDSTTYFSVKKCSYRLSQYADHASMLDWPDGTGPEGMHYYYKDVPRYDAEKEYSDMLTLWKSLYYIGDYVENDKYIKERIDNSGVKKVIGEVKDLINYVNYKLDNKYFLRIKFNANSFSLNADSLELFESNGDKTNSILKLAGKDLLRLAYNWPSVRIGKLKNEVYVIACSGSYEPVIFVKDGKIIKSSYNENEHIIGIGNTFTLKYFYNRSLLKKRLENPLDDV